MAKVLIRNRLMTRQQKYYEFQEPGYAGRYDGYVSSGHPAEINDVAAAKFGVVGMVRTAELAGFPRVIGFDDAPFAKKVGSPVNVSGIVCAGTRMEGMLWGQATRDGDDATDTLLTMLKGSKFHHQVHLALIDGLTIGGFNVIDLPTLAAEIDRPCIAVMRKMPDRPAIERALRRFDDYERRWGLILKAGDIHQHGAFVYQVAGASPETVALALQRLTDTGHVPECLRLAHLIGSAIKTGSSSRRA